MRAVYPIAMLLGAITLAGTPALAAPTANLHEVKWFVHVDMIGGGLDLAYYENILDLALDDVRINLEGNQGPVDTTCCSQIVKEEHSPGVTLETFGTTGDGLDVIDAGDFDAIKLLGGSGSRAFLIDSINHCGGGPAIGCATRPNCNSTPDDDPTLTMAVTMDAEDSGVLGVVIGHERGHNSCLPHSASNTCELMRSAVAGGCLSAAECDDFTDGRTTTGGSCVCHENAGGPSVDGLACTDGPIVGQCSGGICGETTADAGVQLMAAGCPESTSCADKDDPLLMSGVPGGWTDQGEIGATIKGFAHDPDSDTLYGIQEVIGDDDLLVTVNSSTGAITSTVGTITGHDDVIALAFDPGATANPGDDRLLALSSDGDFEDLIEIDPTNGTPSVLQGLSVGVGGNFQGLAYDSENQKLYTSGFAGGSLWEIDISACGNPWFCTTTEVTSVDLTRINSGLAYSRDTERLHLVGSQSSGRIFYNSIDTTTFEATTRVGIHDFDIGGLSAIPVPEPTANLAVPVGVACLALLTRRRRSS